MFISGIRPETADSRSGIRPETAESIHCPGTNVSYFIFVSFICNKFELTEIDSYLASSWCLASAG